MSTKSDSLRVLVTGGCGFIGVNLARHLLSAGCETVAFDNGSAGRLSDGIAAGYARVIEADIRDVDALGAALNGVDAVVHLAARTGVVDSVRDPRGDLEVNVIGTLNALLAARDAGVRAFVFASSGAPLGEVEQPGHEAIAPRPQSPYGATKLAGEGLCSAFAGSYGLPTTALRFTNVYGPFSYHKGSVIAQFMKRIMTGAPLVVYGDGEQTRDFLYVDDVCRAIVAAIERAPMGELYQLGTGVETSINDLVAVLTEVVSDRPVEVAFEPERAGEARRAFSDIRKARRDLGYNPRTPLRDGLVCTRDWFLESAPS